MLIRERDLIRFEIIATITATSDLPDRVAAW